MWESHCQECGVDYPSAFVFFASQADSGFITGEVLTVLGGETIA